MFDPKTRVLVVDDMLTMRKLVARLVKQFGMLDVIEAPDGQKAWEMLQASDPKVGLVVSDWNMPNLTGVELLKRVRATPEFAALPFVLVTAESEGAQVAEALQAGVSNYVVKPFTPDNLKSKLEAVHQKLTKKAA